MRIRRVPAIVTLLLSAVAAAPAAPEWGWPWGLQDANSLQTDSLAYTGLDNLIEYTTDHGFPEGSNCSFENLAVRAEWYSLDGRFQHVDQ